MVERKNTQRPKTPRLQQVLTTNDFNSRRKERARAKIEARKPPQIILPPTAPDPSTDPEGYVRYIREQTKQSKSARVSLMSQLKPKKRTRAFIPRAERKTIKEQLGQTEKELSQIKTQEQTFETEVAQKTPEYAQPQYKQEAFQTGQSSVQQQVTSIQSKIQTLNKNKQTALQNNQPDKADSLDRDIAIEQARLGSYSSSLGMGTNQFIKEYFAGVIQQKADLAAQQQASAETSAASYSEFQQTPEFQEIITTLDLPATVQPAQLEQALVRYEAKTKAEQLAYDKSLKEQGLTIYDKPLKGYYDPKTGKEILQSIKPEDAKALGYLPIKVLGTKKDGGYLVESVTGLLTPTQLASKKFADIIKKQKTELPTTFILGGDGKPSKIDFESLVSPTAYQIAQRTKPYAKKQAERIEQERIGEKKFGRKYGYVYSPKGEIITVGTVSPVTPWDITSLVGGAKIATFGISKLPALTGFVASEPITKYSSEVVEKIIPLQRTGFAPSGIPSQVGRGLIYSAILANPFTSTAYVTEIVKSASTDPIGTVKEIKNYVLEAPYEVATFPAVSKIESRVKQRLARNELYGTINRNLINEYGKNSVEVVDFNKAWTRAFKELPKRTPLVQSYSIKNLEAIKGDARAIKLTQDIMNKYSPEIIGTTVIIPQTTLKVPPRGKFGDVDIQAVRGLGNKSKQLAYELYNKLKSQGYNIRISKGDFFGSKKYYLRLNGKEFVNIGTSSGYFLKTQHGPLRGFFEAEKFGQFVRDPLTGTLISPIRAQLRVKIAKGYLGADIPKIRQLTKLFKEGKIDAVNKLLKTLKGREKDIIDALGIVKGTEFLIKEGKFIGKKVRQTPTDLLVGGGRIAQEIIREKVGGVRDLLTGKKVSRVDEGYYLTPPPKRDVRIRYEKPRKEELGYDPSSYITPRRYKRPIRPKYKKPKYDKPADYLVSPIYKEPTKPKYKAPKYEKPKYSPYQVLVPGYGPPIPKEERPPYTPPPKRIPSIIPQLTQIRRRPEEKKIPKKPRERRPSRYAVLPTAYEQAIFGTRGRKAKKKVSGFEILRFEKPRRRKKVKKKKEKDTNKVKGNLNKLLV